MRKSPLKRKRKATRKPTKGAKLPRKAKKPKWTSKEADTAFSLFIRQRDKRCVNCGRANNLTCSHFWGRTNSATRYDPENCDTLCWLPCHYKWEHEKQGEYRDFKLKQLGQERYNALEKRARSIYKRSDALEDCRKLLSPAP